MRPRNTPLDVNRGVTSSLESEPEEFRTSLGLALRGLIDRRMATRGAGLPWHEVRRRTDRREVAA